MKNEYDFVWTQEYQDQVDDIIETLVFEHPFLIQEIESKHLEFEVKALIIHAINYSRQLKNVKKQRRKVKDE